MQDRQVHEEPRAHGRLRVLQAPPLGRHLHHRRLHRAGRPLFHFQGRRREEVKRLPSQLLLVCVCVCVASLQTRAALSIMQIILGGRLFWRFLRCDTLDGATLVAAVQRVADSVAGLWRGGGHLLSLNS